MSFLLGFSSLLLLSSSLSLLLEEIFLLFQRFFFSWLVSFSFLLLGISRNSWLDDEIFWVIYSDESSASASFLSPLFEKILMVIWRFFIGCLLKSEASKENFLILRVWYWLFDYFMLASNSNSSEKLEVSNTTEFLLLNMFKNNYVRLGERFLISLFLVDNCTFSISC